MQGLVQVADFSGRFPLDVSVVQLRALVDQQARHFIVSLSRCVVQAGLPHIVLGSDEAGAELEQQLHLIYVIFFHKLEKLALLCCELLGGFESVLHVLDLLLHRLEAGLLVEQQLFVLGLVEQFRLLVSRLALVWSRILAVSCAEEIHILPLADVSALCVLWPEDRCLLEPGLVRVLIEHDGTAHGFAEASLQGVPSALGLRGHQLGLHLRGAEVVAHELRVARLEYVFLHGVVVIFHLEQDAPLADLQVFVLDKLVVGAIGRHVVAEVLLAQLSVLQEVRSRLACHFVQLAEVFLLVADVLLQKFLHHVLDLALELFLPVLQHAELAEDVVLHLLVGEQLLDLL